MVPAVGMALTQMATIAASVYSRRTLAPRALAVQPVADLQFRTVC
jgi:hypothetical protein